MSITQLTLSDKSEAENIYSKAAEALSSGLVTLLEPPLNNVKKQLNELEDKHKELIDKLHDENAGLAEVQYSQELQAMLTKMKLYHSKLQGVKKDMKLLHERSTKLKKRAIRLKEIKEKQPIEEVIITKPTHIIASKGFSGSSSQPQQE